MNMKIDIRPYFPVPFAVLKKGLSMTAVVLYGILLNRYLLSAMNRQVDERGEVYLVYPITELMDLLERKKDAVIQALHELERNEFIIINRRGFKAANQIYVIIPKKDTLENPTYDTLENPTFQRENPTSYIGKTRPDTSGKPDPNNYNNNIYNNNNTHHTSTPYKPPSDNGYRGRNIKRKDAGSTMFAPIPDYENCESYGL